MLSYILLSCVACALCAFYFYVTSNSNYWKVRNVPHEKPLPIVGNYGDFILFRSYMGYIVQRLCKKFPNAPYIGTFYGTDPALLVQDPELLKLILTKDFVYFSGRESDKFTEKEVFSKNMFSSGGDKWKVIRHNMTPLFTSSKLKKMFHLIEKCAFQLETFLEKEVDDVVELKSLMTRYTMGCIGSCAFGVDTKTLEKPENPNEKNRFTEMGDQLLSTSHIRTFFVISRVMWPALFYALGLKSFPKAFSEYFSNFIGSVFESRNNKPSSRNDFIDFLLGLKEKKYLTADTLSSIKYGLENKKIQIEIDDEWLFAQCLMFFAAGFESSSTTLSWICFELAKDKEAQRRAQEEVDAYLKRHNNTMTYDCINELPFLEACMDETMRIYPALSVMTRETMDDYTLPTGLVLKKGLRVHIPVYALHHNPEHFSEPEKFIPERFLGENKKNIKPYTYIPFGEGPRSCIGTRFAKMQMMPGLINILKRFDLDLAPNMEADVILKPKSLIVQGIKIKGLHLKVKVREDADSRRFDRSHINF